MIFICEVVNGNSDISLSKRLKSTFFSKKNEILTISQSLAKGIRQRKMLGLFVRLAGSTLMFNCPVLAVEPFLALETELQEDGSMSQVTNVNELRDVAPSDWAFEALRSLVDRYGCIVGFPDQTYRGNQPLSRYEFAAGLNFCLNQIERLIAASEAVIREDIETINRLMKEFEA